jgi:leucyl aminopeptidase
MEFKTIVDTRARSATACAILGVFENGELGGAAKQIDAQIGGLIRKLHAGGDFAGKLGDSFVLARPAGARATRLLLIGLGARANFNRKAYRRALQAAAQGVAKTGAGDALVYLTQEAPADLDATYGARLVAEVFAANAYRIPDLKTGPRPKAARLHTVSVVAADAKSARAAQRGLEVGAATAAGQRLSRDLANLPPNICTPTYIGAQAQKIGKQFASVKVKVLGLNEIKALKMGAFLAVTQGSAEPPRFIVCEYRGADRSVAPICLVGKGITFDSGGISLKDPPAMDEMKFDMSGAASVIGTLRAVAELKLALNLVVLVASCENMPSGTATKPADIVTTMSGQTVEILNTDAEGRLVLCDALTYSRRYKPDAVIDVATLTGACVIALGSHFSGLMSNDEKLAEELEAAGVRTDDRAWRMPMGEEYAEQLKSNFADLANIGGREGGACSAASFLWKFVQGMRWAHLDIAGTAWHGGAQKGSTGRPVSLLVDFLIGRAHAT